MDTYKLQSKLLLEISPNPQEIFHTINTRHRNSTTRKRVREDNVEHAQYHLAMSPKVSTHNVACNA